MKMVVMNPCIMALEIPNQPGRQSPTPSVYSTRGLQTMGNALTTSMDTFKEKAKNRRQSIVKFFSNLTVPEGLEEESELIIKRNQLVLENFIKFMDRNGVLADRPYEVAANESN